MKLPVAVFACCGLLLGATASFAAAETQETQKDCAPAPVEPTGQAYPTSVIADYVLGCMLANGTSPESLRKCSCSMDYIAESIPYDEYERIETLMSLQQIPGAGRNAVYKDSTWAKTAVNTLREVQAESTLRCF